MKVNRGYPHAKFYPFKSSHTQEKDNLTGNGETIVVTVNYGFVHVRKKGNLNKFTVKV